MGAAPRFFNPGDLPAPLSAGAGKAGGGLYALAAWSRELATAARTVEHPYNPGLMLESLVSRARLALNTK
jgi:DNA polymerase-3 subunit delta'